VCQWLTLHYWCLSSRKIILFKELYQILMRILAIDGGGIRGIYAAYILNRIAEEFGITFCKCFDLIVGTSTGAIIAAALATNHPISDVVKLYEQDGRRIFKKQL